MRLKSASFRSAFRAAPRALLVALGCTATGTLAILVHGVTGPGRTTDRFASYPFLDMWIRWDAGWYQAIATEGYYFSASEQSSAAFFPIYPLLIRGLVRLGADPFLAGSALTLCFGVLASVLVTLWAEERAGPTAARRASWLLLLWPFAFYLYGAVYADALFLFLVAGAFLFLERGQLGASTLLAALATATRPLALAVVVGLLIRQRERRRQAGQGWGAADFAPLLALLGLGAFMAYLGYQFGDPLAFARTQAGWNQLTGLGAVLKAGLFEKLSSPADLVLPLLHAALALFALALAVPMRRRLGLGYSAYVALGVGIPLLTSRDFIGLGRYALAAFPSFLVLALFWPERPRLLAGWVGASLALLFLMTYRFAIGRYVS